MSVKYSEIQFERRRFVVLTGHGLKTLRREYYSPQKHQSSLTQTRYLFFSCSLISEPLFQHASLENISSDILYLVAYCRNCRNDLCSPQQRLFSYGILLSKESLLYKVFSRFLIAKPELVHKNIAFEPTGHLSQVGRIFQLGSLLPQPLLVGMCAGYFLSAPQTSSPCELRNCFYPVGL